MIRMEVNAGDFLKSILHVGDFTRQFNAANISYMHETHGQYWGNGVYSLFHLTYLIFGSSHWNYYLKYVFPKTIKNPLKVAGYKTAAFIKLNSSRVIFKDF